MGRLAEAEAAAREALSLADEPDSRVRLQRALAIVLFFRGDRTGGRDLFLSIGQAPESPEEERPADLSLAALASIYVGDLEGAEALAEAGKTPGEQAGNEFAIITALMFLCAVARLKGVVPQALELGTKAVGFASRVQTRCS